MKYAHLVSVSLCIAVGSAGCSRAVAVAPVQPIATVVQEPTASSPLDAIYPEEVRNVLSLAPDWALPTEGKPLAESLKRLSFRVDWLEANEQKNYESLANVIDTILILLFLERALETEECDSACLDLRIRVYYAMAPWDALFKVEGANSLLDLALEKLGLQLEARESIRKFLSDIFANSDRVWRHLAIDRVRMEGVSPETKSRLLRDLAKAQSRDGEFDRAGAIYSLALDSVSDSERVRLLYSMATSCYQNLDSRCGNSRTEEAGKLSHTPPTETEVGWQETMVILRDAAADVDRLKGAKGKSFDDSLALAHSLTELSRHEQAKKILVALQKKHPKDARPIVGLAGLLIGQDFQTGAARKLLLGAKEFENRNTHYYELRVGTWFEDFLKMQSEPDSRAKISAGLDELEEAVKEYALLDRDRGGTLQYVIRIGRELLQMRQGTKPAAAIRAVLDESIVALVAELNPANFSEFPYLRRLQLILARFDMNTERALATVGTEAKLEKLSDLHAQIRFALVLAHKQGRETFSKEMEAAQSFIARDIQTGILATIAFTTKDQALWSKIEGQLERLLEENTDSKVQHRLMNNLAIAYYRQGRKGEAAQLLRKTLQEQSEPTVAILNSLALNSDSSAEKFKELISAGITKSTTYQARLWQARKTKKRALRPAEVRALAEIEVNKRLNARVNGDEGVLLEQGFNWGFGYASREHLVVITLDLNVRPWFIVPGTERGLK